MLEEYFGGRRWKNESLQVYVGPGMNIAEKEKWCLHLADLDEQGVGGGMRGRPCESGYTPQMIVLRPSDESYPKGLPSPTVQVLQQQNHPRGRSVPVHQLLV